MHSIAVVNLKGGSGKTTTALSLAVGCRRRKKHVLLVDADPQANATMTMLDGATADAPTLGNVLLDEADGGRGDPAVPGQARRPLARRRQAGRRRALAGRPARPRASARVGAGRPSTITTWSSSTPRPDVPGDGQRPELCRRAAGPGRRRPLLDRGPGPAPGDRRTGPALPRQPRAADLGHGADPHPPQQGDQGHRAPSSGKPTATWSIGRSSRIRSGSRRPMPGTARSWSSTRGPRRPWPMTA